MILAAGAGLFSCTPGSMGWRTPVAKEGRVDASSLNFNKGDTLYLKGEWKFTWREDDPSFADPRYDDASWKSLAVPGYWNGLTGTGNGYGWYRLRVKVDGDRLRASGERLALSVLLIQSACEVYVNGSRVMASGTFGTDRSSSVPQIRPHLVAFDPPRQGDEIVIAVRNANFFHRSGGPYSTPELGLHSVLLQRLWYYDVVRLVALGIILMMGIYHVMLWFGRRADRASLYFSMVCFLVLMRLVATNGYLERLFPSFTLYELHFKMVYMSMPLIWIAFGYFFRDLFPEEFPKRLFNIIIAAGVILSAATIVLPCRLYSVYSMVYEALALVIAAWYLICVVMATWRTASGAWYILPGALVFFITAVHDVLAVKLIIGTPEVAPVGLVILIFSQSALLSRRFARAYTTAEHLSKNLAAEVSSKTLQLQEQMEVALRARQEAESSRAELKDTYEQLRSLYAGIKNDLNVARNIQNALFPTDSGAIMGLRYRTMYIPLIEVGGDIYDICRIGDGVTRFFLADAMGHGINASLITMLIKAEYEALKLDAADPLKLIRELNTLFYRHYRPVARYFTSFLADIDPAGGRITYVSSGHPAQYLVRSGGIIELGTTGRAMGFTEHTNCTVRETEYLPGDRLFFFTDGLYEQFDGSRTLYGEERLRGIIMENAGRSVPEIVDAVIADIVSHTGEDRNDDMLIIGVDRE